MGMSIGIVLFCLHAVVGKPDAIEFNASVSLHASRRCRIRDFNRGIQQLENAFAGSHRRLEDVVLFAQVLNRPEESLRILNEGDYYAERYRTAQHLASTKPDHKRNRQRR